MNAWAEIDPKPRLAPRGGPGGELRIRLDIYWRIDAQDELHRIEWTDSHNAQSHPGDSRIPIHILHGK